MQFVTLQEVSGHNVRLWSQDGEILAVIPGEVLKDAAGIPGSVDLDNEMLIRLAMANADPLGRVATKKAEAGETMPAEPGKYPSVIIRAEDIAAAGERLSGSVITAAPFGWGMTFTAKD